MARNRNSSGVDFVPVMVRIPTEWNERILKEVGVIMPVASWLRQAIKEKLDRLDLEKKEEA